MIDAVILFLALLTVVAQLAVLVIPGLAIGAGRWRAAARLHAALLADVAPQALALAWLVAVVATGGSLFLSEVAAFPPCILCWYQRIAMYPLVLVLGVAAWRRDPGVRPYAGPLVGVGLAIAGYHCLLQHAPSLSAVACDPRAPCTMDWIWEFGYVSIPLMAASAFALIGVLLWLAGRQEIDHRDESADG
jgi:disulfide bond formation protein DsbB